MKCLVLSGFERWLVLLPIAWLVGCGIALPTLAPRVDTLKPNIVRQYNHSSGHEITDNIENLEHRISGWDSFVMLGCDKRHVPTGGFGDKQAALTAYPYALMASNTYRAEAQFLFPSQDTQGRNGWVKVSHFRGFLDHAYEGGFQADLYERVDSEKQVTDVVFAFRGTEDKADWIANLAFWIPLLHGPDERAPVQYVRARQLVDWVMAQPRYRTATPRFTGHSLGAGLALHAAWNYPNARVFVFNASPRIWVDRSNLVLDKNNVWHLHENEDMLWWVRAPFARLPVNQSYEYNFREVGGMDEHSMYYLARGLLYYSARLLDPDAMQIFEANLDCENFLKNYQKIDLDRRPATL